MKTDTKLTYHAKLGLISQKVSQSALALALDCYERDIETMLEKPGKLLLETKPRKKGKLGFYTQSKIDRLFRIHYEK